MVDLGMSPLCESFLTREQLDSPETFYPLRVLVCEVCFLAQLDVFATPDEIFTEYAYFSSYSDSWLDHCHRYVDEVSQRFGIGPESLVVEVASNDGYLLRWFVERGVPVLGVEPASNVAEAARSLGVETVVDFFGRRLGAELRAGGVRADLIVGNNVLAQVPDLHDFVGGFLEVLAPNGVITLEFPHLMRLLAEDQFDTIYHEHFSYFSLTTCQDIFRRHDLEVFDVEELSTHGGSLRLFLKRADDSTHTVTERVARVAEAEKVARMGDPETYRAFGRRAESVKRNLLALLIAIKDREESIVGYGAAGKGNTLLNYCAIRSDFLDFIADRNPYKIGRFTPGTHIPIVDPSEIALRRPDHILILPWNLGREISEQLAFVADWGADLILPIPSVQVIEPGMTT